MKKSSAERTLFMSVLLSAPGPLAVGIGLLVGKSSTQLADFVRRTAELAALVVSWLVYRALHRDGADNQHRKMKLEFFATGGVGIAMCLGGVTMALLALFSSADDKGNVVPGLIIALLGVVTNSWFWFRYARLHQEQPSAILAVQIRLYRAKSLVDLCVTAALLSVLLSPGSQLAKVMDTAGSLVVAAYLVVSGVRVLMGRDGKPGRASPAS